MSIIGVLLATPQLSIAQENTTTLDIAELQKAADAALAPSDIVFTEVEKAIWKQKIQDGSLDELDKRLTNIVLPALAQQFGQINVDILKDYADDSQKTSRLLDGVTNDSQRHSAKAAVVRSLGTVSCGTTVYFARSLDPKKPLWLNQATDDPSSHQTSQPFFGRSFDSVARQSLFLPIRSFTNRLITSQSWSNMLQQIAKGEIEERFNLPAGALSNSAVSDLDSVLAQARLARQLGLPSLPTAKDETDLYTKLGQRNLELALNLPANSFTSQNNATLWRETYQNIGVRVLEQQLAMPETGTEQPLFPATTALLSNSRFQLLAKRLQTRAALYKDPAIALNLPTAQFLPTSSTESDLVTRLANGDPDAFAAVGAYFLADSLELPSSQTTTIVQAAAKGEERPISLAEARPLDNTQVPDKLFSIETNLKARQAIFEQIGRQYESIIKNHLPQLSENVLMAISDGSNTPSYNDIITVITNTSRRQDTLQKLAPHSVADANYTQFTTEELKNRGQKLLSDALNIPVSSLNQLEATPDSNGTRLIGEQVDSALGWPTVNEQPLSRLLATNKATDEQIIKAGSDLLWQRLGYTDTLSAALTSYFQTGIAVGLAVPTPHISTVTPDTSAEGVDLTTPAAGSSTTIPPVQPDTSASGDTSDGSGDETVTFAIPAAQEPLLQALTTETGLPLTALTFLADGRLQPALERLSLATIGQDLATGSRITPAKLIAAYSQPSAENNAVITNQGKQVFTNNYLLDPNFIDSLTKLTANTQQFERWQLWHNEIIRQWNITCPSQQVQAKQALNKLINFIATWPTTENGVESNDPTAPIQIFVSAKDLIDANTQQTVNSTYDTNNTDTKTGLFTAPRLANEGIYIGY